LLRFVLTIVTVLLHFVPNNHHNWHTIFSAYSALVLKPLPPHDIKAPLMTARIDGKRAHPAAHHHWMHGRDAGMHLQRWN
jgi:hypothetical protein